MSSDPATLFNEAVALHRAGQLLKAQTIYQQILQENSQNISVWRYLASALSQSGDLSQAIETLKTALAKAGPHAALHHDMGSLFLIQRAHHEAITSLRIANSLDPQNKEILLNLAQAYLQDKQFLAAENTLNFLVKTQPTFALAHFEMGRLHTLNDDQHSARDAYLEAIRYAPNFAEAYAMLGNTFLSLNNILRAIEAYTSALKIRPDLPGGYYNLALAEIANKNPQRSIEFLKQALLLTPKSAEVFSLLSQAYLENNDLDNAVTAGKTALEINPTFTPAIINLGNAFRDHGKHQEAINLYERALNKEPQNLGLLTNLGNAYLSLGNMPASNDYYRRALTLDPNHFHAKWQLGLLLLLQGQFDKGWHLYEERQHLPEFESLRRDQIAPAWHGQNLKNGTLLLWTEQGLGDSIQFVRLAQQARKFCGKIILQCPPSLKWLFQTVSGIDEVIGINEPRPTHDAQTSLMSLPALLRINPAQLPPFASYLRSNADRAAYWRHRLETLPRPWIGISWQGSLRNRSDRHRSIPLHYFAPLAHTHGALISLQQIYGLEQIATCGFEHRLTQFEEMDKGDAAFFDTAALMESLDVIVTSDTAIAHLGGALGRPTWVALQNMPDWRWMMATPTSPWYPTMRLFRQPSPGDWTSVMNFIAQELHRLA